jgi:hypothetical protein
LTKYKGFFEWSDGVSFTTNKGGGIADVKYIKLSKEHVKAINELVSQIKEKPLSERMEPLSKYHREIKPNVLVDVYDVLGAFTGGITSHIKPAIDHAIKKLLAPGTRGAKDERQDLAEARDSLNRAIQQLDEWA